LAAPNARAAVSVISARTVRVQPQELAKHAYQTHSSPGAVQISVQSARAVLQGNSARAVGALSLETARHVRTEPSSNTKESWLATAAAVPRASFGHHVVTHMQKNAGSALPERSRLPSTHLGVWHATSVRLGSSARGAGEQARGHAPPVLQMERPPLERRRMCSARGVGAAALPASSAWGAMHSTSAHAKHACQALSNQTTGLNRAKFAIHVGQKRTAAVVAGSFLGHARLRWSRSEQ